MTRLLALVYRPLNYVDNVIRFLLGGLALMEFKTRLHQSLASQVRQQALIKSNGNMALSLCWYCHGAGTIAQELAPDEADFVTPFDQICPQCKGTGKGVVE